MCCSQRVLQPSWKRITKSERAARWTLSGHSKHGWRSNREGSGRRRGRSSSCRAGSHRRAQQGRCAGVRRVKRCAGASRRLAWWRRLAPEGFTCSRGHVSGGARVGSPHAGKCRGGVRLRPSARLQPRGGPVLQLVAARKYQVGLPSDVGRHGNGEGGGAVGAASGAAVGLRAEGYVLLRQAVRRTSVEGALRLLNLAIRRHGLTAEEIQSCQQTTFFPHLRWEPEVWAVLPAGHVPSCSASGGRRVGGAAASAALSRRGRRTGPWSHISTSPRRGSNGRRYRGIVGRGAHERRGPTTGCRAYGRDRMPASRGRAPSSRWRLAMPS